MKLLILLFFSSHYTFAFEMYLHRTQEVLSTADISWSDKCLEMKRNDLASYFDFTRIEDSTISGLEIDTYFPKSINKLIVYHKSPKSFKPESEFQCFANQYIFLDDYLDFIKNTRPNLKFWIDFKNDNWMGIYKGVKELSESAYKDHLIVEMDNVFGNLVAQYFGVQSSLWVKFSKSSFLNQMRFSIYKFLGFSRFSGACKKIIKNREYLKDAKSVLCWDLKSQKTDGVSELKNLDIVLTSH